MGAQPSKASDEEGIKHTQTALRAEAITGGRAGQQKRGSNRIPPNATKTAPEDYDFIEAALGRVLLFSRLAPEVQKRIAADMYERTVVAGDILIKEGDKGANASELFVVKAGKFEVLQRRGTVNMRVNMKERGDVFGEISLMYSSPRTATVAATTDAAVWVLDRDLFRFHVQEEQTAAISQVELFLNSVPILAKLSREEKLQLVDALEVRSYKPSEKIITEGEDGDSFYIIKEGEAVVYQSSPTGNRQVNMLFKSDFFGEAALLSSARRNATVEARTPLTALVINRATFTALLGPLQDIMAKDKNPQACQARMMKLGTMTSTRQMSMGRKHMPAEVMLKTRFRHNSEGNTVELVRARGHLDEVQEMRKGGSTLMALETGTRDAETLHLTEGQLLGGGAFSRVSIVVEDTTGRTFALKRMRKTAVMQCPEHVFCEQAITRNVVHPFCLRQYASFQDKYHLYLIFDLMPGGDLMDVLVAEAKVIKHRATDDTGALQSCLAPKAKMLQGMKEDLARFYVGSVVLALEYLHSNGIVYRDLKPENVFIDAQGYIKLGDFGFAKQLQSGERTYTFCGTPGYVAPENILAHGYSYSVDWWGLGVLMYVLLTGRQPFSSPKTEDPMVIMRRIVDEHWPIKYPPYLSPAARDLVGKLLERRPARRIGMLSGKVADVKNHKWFAGFDWDALEARRMPPPRRPRQADVAKRLRDLADTERGSRRPRETQEELYESEQTFADF